MANTKLFTRLESLERTLKPAPTLVVDIIRHRDQIDFPHLFEVDTEKHEPPGGNRVAGVTIREFKRID
ncbi:MAG: mobile element hypothetical protein [Bacteroidetes bacterium HLUCCA01]|nr:MAG: mobile element hypothetical protein [Bacteroidetes bacterium HLUCCA01]